MADFNLYVTTVTTMLPLINKYTRSFSWHELGQGNSCWKPSDTADEDAPYIAAAAVAIPRCSNEHIRLMRSIADILGKKWISYDYMIKLVGRISSASSCPPPHNKRLL